MAASEAPTEGLAPDAPVQEAPTPEQREGEAEARPQSPPSTDEKPTLSLKELDELLDRVDPEVLRKSRRFMGTAGDIGKKLARQEAEALAQQRAEQLVQERLDRAEAERSRRAMLETARKGDFYALGQQSARQLLQDDQKQYVDRYKRQATADAYGSVQKVVDEIASGFDPEVVAAAAEKMGELPENARWEDGLKRWLPALIEARAEHMARSPDAKRKVEREVTPAVRSRFVAEMNGTEPVADSGTGRAPTQRIVTDEQIAAMEPEEYLSIYDIKAGKFKPGVVYKPTRALDPRALQMTGRGA